MNKFFYLLSKLNESFAEKVYCNWLKVFVRKKGFTIISNNCWGGGIYENMNLKYSSPTIGLYFFAPCYIKFITHLNEYLKLDFQFIQHSKYAEANEDRTRRNLTYPIGVLNDVEVHFLHYASENEAVEKWGRRKKRINFDNLFVKFCDRDLCSDDEITAFAKLEFKNKVFFSSRENRAGSSLVFLKDYQNDACVGSLYEHPWSYRKHFNIVKWLNK